MDRAGLAQLHSDSIRGSFSRLEVVPASARGVCEQARLASAAVPDLSTYLVAGRGRRTNGISRAAARTLPCSMNHRRLVRLRRAPRRQLRAAPTRCRSSIPGRGVAGRAFERWCLHPTVEIVRRVREEIPGRGSFCSRRNWHRRTDAAGARKRRHCVGIGSETDRRMLAKISAASARVRHLNPLTLVAGGDHSTGVDEVLLDLRGTRHISSWSRIRSWTPVEHVGRMIARIKGR